MRITSLLENTSCRPDMQTEHGLSLYIETERHKILFDMGQTDLFYKNAETLGIDLSRVDIAILSHGHYDHGGGLGKFLAVNDSAPVYINRAAFRPYYNGTEKYIGLDMELKDSPRIIFTDDSLEIDDSLTLFSCNGREKNYPVIPSGLNEKVGDSFVPDSFLHEQYLLINEGDCSVLISGCSHKGILDIAEWFSPNLLVGGFHYSKLPTDQALAQKAILLDAVGAEFYTCHCTGVEQYQFMRKYMKKLNYLSCGQTINI